MEPMSTQPPTWPAVLSRVLAGEDLPVDVMRWVMGEVMKDAVSPAQLAGFLVAMRGKGVSVEELWALSEEVLERAVGMTAPPGAVDIVGTGGDGAHTVNVSTMASLVVAGAGIPVVKHGNRASSSSSGSADVLDHLGVRLDASPHRVQEIVHEVGITFCFAQVFHPAMRFAAPVRKELGIPTVFNLLGPLTNPARVRAAALGVAFENLLPVIAGVIARRGHCALVFRGEDGLDELSIAARSRVLEVAGESIHEHWVHPSDVGLAEGRLSDLAGANAAFNAGVARRVMEGAHGPVRDAVVLNAAAAIVAANIDKDHSRARAGVPDFIERLGAAVQVAKDAIDSGRANNVLQQWVRASQAPHGHVAANGSPVSAHTR